MRCQRVAGVGKHGREFGERRPLLGRASLGSGVAFRGRGVEAGVEAEAADQGRAPRQGVGKRMDGEDDPAAG